MLRVVVIACLAVVCLGASMTSPFYYDVELNPYWETYKSSYNKNYAAADEPMRRSIWEQNLKFIREHNLQADLGMHSYRLGINEYADLRHEEYLKFLTGARVANVTRKGALFLPPNNVQVPDEIDWRTKGYVTPIKNQGQCGSCWAFSTTGSVEGQHFRATSDLVSLSEQNLVDCSKDNNGCNGGMMDYAFEYIISNNGIDTEESYPYEGVEEVCRFKASNVGATISAFTDVASQDESALKEALGTVGPVSVAIDAAHPSFQLYKTGVYDEPECSSTALDHGVLAVGYGTYNGEDYWLVKNSWGTSWGIDGYIMMSRNKNNQCGIATMASYPQV